MTNEYLENLVRVGKLHRVRPSEEEISNLIRKGLAKLNDLAEAELSAFTRFDVAYNAAHALSLAAVWRAGYRSDSCYLVFQCTQHTLDLDANSRRVLDLAHRNRNRAEYEGDVDVEESMIEALTRVSELIAKRVQEI